MLVNRMNQTHRGLLFMRVRQSRPLEGAVAPECQQAVAPMRPLDVALPFTTVRHFKGKR